MNKDSTLFWSHLKMYEECPQKFLWTKGWDGVDLGNGDGKPKTPTEKISRHHAIMGIAIHHAFEILYNDELWRDGKVLSDKMEELAVKEFDKLYPKSHIDLEKAKMTMEEMRQIVADGARGYIQTMKRHRLLGPFAKSEQKIIAWIDKWNPIGGILDAIIRRDDSGVMILDGKNASAKELVDTDQLVFYALLYKLAYKQLPDKLGVIWFRYPFSEESGEEGITWVEFKDEDLTRVATRAKTAKHNMYKKKFPAKPSRMSCLFCEYKDACAERKAELEVSEIDGKGDGFSDFSL